MKAQNFNIAGGRPHILIAPLDWGLGHATRCIPIISALIQQDCVVIVAASAQIKILIQNEFPSLQFIELSGYRIQYSRYRFWMPVTLILQLPKLIYRIYAENRWLKKTVKAIKIDAVVSDNRLGLFNKKIPCIYITHQLTIMTGNRFPERITQKIHYHFINKFNACWVPDASGKINLAGGLSHPVVLPKTPVTYLGPLSRFDKINIAVKYDLCIILSGPEPQRTVFEKMLLHNLKAFQGSVFFLRGLPEKTSMPELNNPAIEIKNHLTAADLNGVLQQSKIIICRSGYTSVMDLFKLQKKAILVPTPGQTEQEYLAKYLFEKRLFYYAPQKGFSLQDEIKNGVQFLQDEIKISLKDYEAVIERFVAEINKAGY